jgi:hypothetical protein
MANVLSQKHLRVYRIFLINGHYDYEAFLRLLLEIAKLSNLGIGEGITSYLIKQQSLIITMIVQILTPMT